jgi:creatinine amidohydrolase
MLWSDLTSTRFPQAVRDCGGLCLLPFGAIERHGPHLPLGTDQICADEVARRAAQAEPAVVFPSYWFGQVFTARQCAGTVVMGRSLLLPLLDAAVDEIARNGFRKILILNGHGGNPSLLHLYVRSLLEEPHDYVVYTTNYYELDDESRERWRRMRRTDYGDHGDEMETSVMLYLRPDLVHMESLTGPEDGLPRGRQQHLAGLGNPMSWYADHPTHYSGDGRAATAEKGRFVVEAWVRRVAQQVRAIKADEVTAELQRQFHREARRPGQGTRKSL